MYLGLFALLELLDIKELIVLTTYLIDPYNVFHGVIRDCDFPSETSRTYFIQFILHLYF